MIFTVLALSVVGLVLALPGGAVAPPTQGLFQLDSDGFASTTSGFPVTGDDWNCLFGTLHVNGTAGNSTGDAPCSPAGGNAVSKSAPATITDPTLDNSDDILGQGSKDILDLNQWAGVSQKPPAKDDLAHAVFGNYTKPVPADAAHPLHDIVYFGADRISNNGSAFLGFWFFRSHISENADGTFNGVHSVGDILVLANFVQGNGSSKISGATQEIGVFKWVGTGGDVNGTLQTLTPVGTGSCATSGADACAIFNTENKPTPWPFQSADSGDAANTWTPSEFVEGGIDLTALVPDEDCFTTTMAETRSSASPTAEQKDIHLEQLNTCGTIKIVKDAVPNDPQSFPFTTQEAALTPQSFSLVDNGAAGTNTQQFDNVAPGTYHVGETLPVTGWDLTNIVCVTSDGTTVDADTSVNVGTGVASITVGRGEVVTCTYTNKPKPQVKVVKALLPANDTGKFDLTIGGTTYDNNGAGFGDTGTTGFVVQNAGATPAVGEAAHTGTSLTDYESSVSCDNGQSGTGTSITLNALTGGQKVTCTVTNKRKPQVKVVKALLPANDTGKFDLTIGDTSFDNGGAGFGDTGTTGFVNQAVGATPAVGETGHTGTSLSDYESSLSCDNGQTLASGTSLTLNALSAGAKVTCTVTNKRKPQVKVVKTLVPANDTGTFDFAIGASSFDNGGAGYVNGGTTGFDNQAVGATPAVSESGHGTTSVSDYTSAISCDNGQAPASGTSITLNALAAGAKVTCTITNTRKPLVKVVKALVPSNDTGKFDFAIGAASFDNGGSGYGDTGTTGFVSQTVGATPGISESAHSGTSLSDYSSSFSCSNGQTGSGTSLTLNALVAGDKVTCTFTNKRLPQVKVVKTLLPANDTGKFDFAIAASTFNNGGSGFGDGGTTGFVNQAIGATPLVAESGHTGTTLSDYSSSFSCSTGQTGNATSVTLTALAAGDRVTCTFTNSRLPQVKLVKNLVPSNDTGRFDFAIGASTFNNGGAGFGDTGTTGFVAQAVGATPLVGESGHTGTTLANYESSISCDNGQALASGTSLTLNALSAGAKVTCTVTNKRKPQVKLVKALVPANDTGKFDFTIGAAGFDNAGAGFGNNGTTGFVNQAVGATAAVSEAAHTGTSLSDYESSLSCDNGQTLASGTSLGLSALAAGDKVTCTFTNKRKPQVKVVKALLPANDTGKFDFSIGASSFDNGGAGFGDTGTTGFVNQAVGATPAVAEAAHTGTSLSDYESSVSCDNGQSGSGTSITLNALTAGAKVTCTITNKRKPQVKVVKALLPANDTGRFDFSIGASSFDNGGAGFGDTGTTGFVTQAVGATPAVGETGHTGTTLTDYVSSIACDNGQSGSGTSITLNALAAGAKVTCTITNKKKAHLQLVKTENGGALTAVYTFALTGGPDNVNVAKDTSGGSTLDFGLLKPGTYQLCETGVAAGTTPVLTSPAGYTMVLVDATTGKYCVDVTPASPPQEFTLDPGDNVSFAIDNQHPLGGQRTIGYWKNWNRCTSNAGQLANAAKTGKALADDFLPVTLVPASGLYGGVILTTCAQEVTVLGTPAGKYMEHQMAAQLLAAILNVDAGASCPAIASVISHAQSLLQQIQWNGSASSKIVDGGNPLRADFAATASTLDQFNNGLLC